MAEKYNYEQFIKDAKVYAWKGAFGGWGYPFRGLWQRFYSIFYKAPKLEDYKLK